MGLALIIFNICVCLSAAVSVVVEAWEYHVVCFVGVLTKEKLLQSWEQPKITACPQEAPGLGERLAEAEADQLLGDHSGSAEAAHRDRMGQLKLYLRTELELKVFRTMTSEATFTWKTAKTLLFFLIQ